jgi:protoheme IX farnesyltransferase
MNQVDTPASSEHLEPTAEPPTGMRWMVMDLTKLRLNALVLLTTAVGYVLGRVGIASFDWGLLVMTMLGTGLAAASAAILNQALEQRRDSRMHRTRERPVASGRLSPVFAFVVGIGLAYAGFALLAGWVGITPAVLAVSNVIVYAFIYTPLKPLTTTNTLFGAVCGAIPPMIGWSAATGGLEAGAWVLGGILFVWQLPHFFALAWMYREDYRRGGHAMLPVLDPTGRITGQVMTTTAALLVPVGLTGTMFGVAGWFSAAAATVCGSWFALRCLQFWRSPSDEAARTAFLTSLAYLPIVLGVMVVDRGPVTPESWIRGGRPPLAAESDEPRMMAPESKVDPSAASDP